MEVDPNVIDQLSPLGLTRAYIRQLAIDQLLQERMGDIEIPATLLQDFMNRHEIFDESGLLSFLRRNLLKKEQLEKQLVNSYRIDCYVAEFCASKASSRFLQQKDSLDQVVYSLIRVNSLDLASELYLRISEGEDSFADLASEASQGPERSTCGIVGPVPVDQAHPRLAEKLRSAAIGSLIEPFQVDQWWLLVRLESKQPAVCDDHMKMQLALEIFDEEVDSATEKMFDSLSSKFC